MDVRRGRKGRGGDILPAPMSETSRRNVLNELEALGPAARSWLASATLEDGPGRSLLLNLPSAFVRDALRERCGQALASAARSAGYAGVDLRVVDARHPTRPSFPSFRVTRENQLAYAAVSSLALRLRPEIHPLVLQGPPGCGKSHLLAALQDASRSRDALPMIATDPGRLSRRLGLAAKNGKLAEFRASLRSCRLLLIDQADRLETKTKTQTELLHALDALGSGGGVAVLAFRTPFERMKGLTDHLKSRLQGGLCVHLSSNQEESTG